MNMLKPQAPSRAGSLLQGFCVIRVVVRWTKNLWRASLLASGCAAVVKPANAVGLPELGGWFWGRCATQREQARSPQGPGDDENIFRHSKTPSRKHGVFYCPTHSPCRSEPARDSGCSANEYVEAAGPIASRLTPTRVLCFLRSFEVTTNPVARELEAGAGVKSLVGITLIPKQSSFLLQLPAPVSVLLGE